MSKGQLVFPFLFSVVSTMAGAAERHLGPHVHGQASVNVSTEANTLVTELSLPGHDAVGFEHPPSGADEKAALAHAMATLEKGAWLVPVPEAGCTLVSHKIEPHGFGGVSETGSHADFDAEYRFTCAHIERLESLDVRLNEVFPSVTKVVVGVIADAGSAERTLEGSDTRVVLPK